MQISPKCEKQRYSILFFSIFSWHEHANVVTLASHFSLQAVRVEKTHRHPSVTAAELCLPLYSHLVEYISEWFGLSAATYHPGEPAWPRRWCPWWRWNTAATGPAEHREKLAQERHLKIHFKILSRWLNIGTSLGWMCWCPLNGTADRLVGQSFSTVQVGLTPGWSCSDSRSKLYSFFFSLLHVHPSFPFGYWKIKKSFFSFVFGSVCSKK